MDDTEKTDLLHERHLFESAATSAFLGLQMELEKLIDSVEASWLERVAHETVCQWVFGSDRALYREFSKGNFQAEIPLPAGRRTTSRERLHAKLMTDRFLDGFRAAYRGGFTVRNDRTGVPSLLDRALAALLAAHDAVDTGKKKQRPVAKAAYCH